MASSNISMLKKTSSNADSDECYTPEEAITPLIKYLSGTVYEPTSEHSSSIVNVLEKHNIKTVGYMGDFLETDFTEYDCIVTNPPYSIKDKFIQKCYETGKPFALLLPVSAIQGIKRGEMFEKYSIELLVLKKRIDFTGKGSPHFGVAWFCHKMLPQQIIFNDLEE